MEPRVIQCDIKGVGPTIVMLPGGLTGWHSWTLHQERLAARYRAIRLQPIQNELGAQGVAGDVSYTAETEREALKLTLDALGIDQAHFAGWSAGSRALIEFALVYPERIQTLTLVEPAANWIAEQLGARNPELEAANAFVHRLAGQDVSEDDLARFLQFAGLVAPGQNPRQHPSWERWLSHRMALSWQTEALGRSAHSVAELATIAAPTLLVKGTVTAGWIKRVVDALARQLPQASVLELDGDHACHIQRIDQFLAAFEAHLNQGAGGRSRLGDNLNALRRSKRS